MSRKPAPYHKDNLRQTLLQAATRLLEEKGSSEFSLREVARAAGVSHTAPYRHFKDKADLLRGIAQQGFDALHEAMLDAQGSHDDIEQQLIAAGVNYVLQAVKSPERAKLMFSGPGNVDAGDETYLQSRAAGYNDLRNIIQRGLNEAIFAGEVDSITLAAWSSVHGMAMLLTAGVTLGISNEADLIIRARTLTQQVIRGFKKV